MRSSSARSDTSTTSTATGASLFTSSLAVSVICDHDTFSPLDPKMPQPARLRVRVRSICDSMAQLRGPAYACSPNHDFVHNSST